MTGKAGERQESKKGRGALGTLRVEGKGRGAPGEQKRKGGARQIARRGAREGSARATREATKKEGGVLRNRRVEGEEERRGGEGVGRPGMARGALGGGQYLKREGTRRGRHRGREAHVAITQKIILLRNY